MELLKWRFNEKTLSTFFTGKLFFLCPTIAFDNVCDKVCDDGGEAPQLILTQISWSCFTGIGSNVGSRRQSSAVVGLRRQSSAVVGLRRQSSAVVGSRRQSSAVVGQLAASTENHQIIDGSGNDSMELLGSPT